MNHHSKTYIYAFIIAIILTPLTILYFPETNQATSFDVNKINSVSIIEYSSNFNYAQYGMTCGPFSVAAVIRVLSNMEIDSFELAKTTKWTIFDFGTPPISLEMQLKETGINVEVPKLRNYSDEEKIKFLQERLSQGNVIIILGELDNFKYQHYLTILGFNSEKDEFYIYDSFYNKTDNNLTIDSNDELPGNRNFTSEELLEFWRRGGMWGIYDWYAIVASKTDN